MMEVQDHSDKKRNRNLNKIGNEVQRNMVMLSRNVYTSRPNSLTPYHWKSDRLWRFNIAAKNKTYLGRHVSDIYFQILIKFGIYRQMLKNPQYQRSRKSVQ
jgi:hypothetical protein